MINSINKFYSLLGLGKCANLIRTGDLATFDCVKKQNSFLVICAQDASDNTKKKCHDKCKHYNVKMVVIGEKLELGKAMGKDIVAVMTVNDLKFAESLLKIYNEIT